MGLTTTTDRSLSMCARRFIASLSMNLPIIVRIGVASMISIVGRTDVKPEFISLSSTGLPGPCRMAPAAGGASGPRPGSPPRAVSVTRAGGRASGHGPVCAETAPRRPEKGSVRSARKPCRTRWRKQPRATVRKRREAEPLMECFRGFVPGLDDRRMHRHTVTRPEDSPDRLGHEELTRAGPMTRSVNRRAPDRGARRRMAPEPARQPFGSRVQLNRPRAPAPPIAVQLGHAAANALRPCRFPGASTTSRGVCGPGEAPGTIRSTRAGGPRCHRRPPRRLSPPCAAARGPLRPRSARSRPPRDAWPDRPARPRGARA